MSKQEAILKRLRIGPATLWQLVDSVYAYAIKSTDREHVAMMIKNLRRLGHPIRYGEGQGVQGGRYHLEYPGGEGKLYSTLARSRVSRMAK